MVHHFYRHYNDFNYVGVNFPYGDVPIYPDFRLAPIPLPLSFPQSFEVASYCSWPHSVQLVDVGGSHHKYEHIDLKNKDNSCANLCKSTFSNVIDSKKVFSDDVASCVCKINSHNHDYKYMCA